MLRPRIDQRDVMSGAGHMTAGDAANGAGAYYYDAFTHG
jgi:hypothetical protein